MKRKSRNLNTKTRRKKFAKFKKRQREAIRNKNLKKGGSKIDRDEGRWGGLTSFLD